MRIATRKLYAKRQPTGAEYGACNHRQSLARSFKSSFDHLLFYFVLWMFDISSSLMHSFASYSLGQIVNGLDDFIAVRVRGHHSIDEPACHVEANDFERDADQWHMLHRCERGIGGIQHCQNNNANGNQCRLLIASRFPGILHSQVNHRTPRHKCLTSADFAYLVPLSMAVSNTSLDFSDQSKSPSLALIFALECLCTVMRPIRTGIQSLSMVAPFPYLCPSSRTVLWELEDI